MCHFPVWLLQGEQQWPLEWRLKSPPCREGFVGIHCTFFLESSSLIPFSTPFLPCILSDLAGRGTLFLFSKISKSKWVTGSEANWLSRKLCEWKAIIFMICDQAKGDSISRVSLVPCSQAGWRCQVNSEGAVPGNISPVRVKETLSAQDFNWNDF